MNAKVIELTTALIPMQFSDTERQIRSDVNKIFDLAEKEGFDWFALTEAGNARHPFVREALLENAREREAHVSVKGDTAIIVPKRLCLPGSFRRGAELAYESSDGVGKHGDKYVTWADWTHPEAGELSAACVHYSRYGRPDAKNPEYRQNLKWNKKYADTIGVYGREHGAGGRKCFVSGDYNIPDNVSDVFFGNPFTTVADELDKYPKAEHGPIDGIASYDRDKRVFGMEFYVIRDNRVRLFTDHDISVAKFGVKKVS